jgi:hypothetical protein
VLLAFSLLFTLLVLEFVVLKLALPFTPLKLHAALPKGIRVLAQSSKRAAVPKDYIALLGDSYAQGFGDWFLATNANRNPPFHSAHLLEERTGRDVISFGASGAGSLRALVTEPVVGVAYLKKTLLFEIADPDVILAYFYEGNDLNDNVDDLRLRFAPAYDMHRLYDPAYFRSFIRHTVIGENDLERETESFRWWDNFFVARFVGRVVDAIIHRKWLTAPSPRWAPGQVNRVIVAGREVPIPDGLQSPSLDLTEQEMKDGLYVFDQALAYLVDQFPRSKIWVVYLPSPLSSYDLASPRVSIQLQSSDDRPTVYAATLVKERSESMRAAIAQSALAHDVRFIDATPRLREASRKGLIHGPKDWKHFNREGYGALVDAILSGSAGEVARADLSASPPPPAPKERIAR